MRRKVPKILQGYIDRSKAEVRKDLENERLDLIENGVFITAWQWNRIAEIDRMLEAFDDE